MKHTLRSFLALGLVLALSAVSARAESHQVASLTTSAASVIVIPGNKVMVLSIANVGANAVNITFDGGSSAGGSDPSTGATGNGQPLASGQTISFYGPYVQGIKISAVMQTSTTTLNITTNAPAGNSTFPTN